MQIEVSDESAAAEASAEVQNNKNDEPMCSSAEVLRRPPSQGESGAAAGVDRRRRVGVDPAGLHLAPLPCAHTPAPPGCGH